MQTITTILAADIDNLVGSYEADEILRVAREWQDAGFDADGVEAWTQAGVFDAQAAAELRDAGVDASKLDRATGYAYANGDAGNLALAQLLLSEAGA